MARILVAEDEAGTRALVVHQLEKDGHQVLQASTGMRAVWMLEDNWPVDLVVTDHMMPELDGRAFIRGMRSSQKYTTVPVIMMSGVVSLSEISSVLAEGANRFLPKPVNMGELREYISILLSES